jgi:hypothetical protein
MFRSHVPLAVHWEANLPTATERPVIRAGIPVAIIPGNLFSMGLLVGS